MSEKEKIEDIKGDIRGYAGNVNANWKDYLEERKKAEELSEKLHVADIAAMPGDEWEKIQCELCDTLEQMNMYETLTKNHLDRYLKKKRKMEKIKEK